MISTQEPAALRNTERWGFAVASGVLGWVLDSFDFFVLVFLFDTLAARFHATAAAIVYTLTVTLALRPVGAVLFGALADRFGRKPALVLCVLYFSACTVFTGFAPSYRLFVLCRALYGIGMGGYWGIGASYALECSPARLRGILSGIIQASYPMGYLLAAVAMQTIAPAFGWRSVFFVGAPAALLLVALTAFAPESKTWQREQPRSLRRIFAVLLEHKAVFLYLLLMMTAMMCLSHGAQDLYPDFLKSIPGLAARTIVRMKVFYGIPVLYNLAAIAGALFFGHLSQRLGRRRSIIAALLLAMVTVPAWAFGTALATLAATACLMQIGVQGAFGVIPAHLNELSPGAVRSLFSGLAYQLGVLLASPATAIEFALRNRFGYPWALAAFETVSIVVMIAVFWLGPEAHNRDFAST